MLHTRGNKNQVILRTPIRLGDFVIPRGVKYVLACENSKGLSFMALEIADEDMAVGDSSLKTLSSFAKPENFGEVRT